MKILALDQSTTNTGWSYFIDNEYIDSGVISKSNRDTDHRIAEMGLAISAKIKELQPDITIIEDIQNQKGVKTVIQLARLQGCIMLYCQSKKIDFKFWHPSEWRSILQFQQGPRVKREELKAQSMKYVKEHFGFDNYTEDRCEAICIGEAASKFFDETK